MQRCVAAYVAATTVVLLVVSPLVADTVVAGATGLCLHTQSDERKERKKKKEIAQHTID